MNNGFEIVIYIFFFILILVGAYYATRWISTKSLSLYKGKNINIIERIPIDKDKSFILLEKGDKVYLIGVTNNNMVVIDNFESDGLAANETLPEDNMTPSNIYNFPKAFVNNMAKFFKEKKFKLPAVKSKTSASSKETDAFDRSSSKTNDFANDNEFDEVLRRVSIRKQHLKEQGKLLKRGGK